MRKRSVMPNCRLALAVASLFAANLMSANAANWANWRGPEYNGSSDETGLPEAFSPESGVKWKAPLPGPAAATPIIYGDRVFVSTVNSRQQTLQAMCLDRATGDVKWARDVGFGINKDDRSNFAANSPVTDGERVVFFYGTGDLAAFDLDGEPLWSMNVQEKYGDFSFLWTFSTSPAIYGDILYMQILQRDSPVQGRGKDGAESYILALDPATGEEKWKHVRPAKAQSESLEAFTTPVLHEENGKRQLLVIGGDCLTSHDPETGEELWRWGAWNPSRIGHWRLVPSAVVGGGVALACAPKGEPIYAIKINGQGTLDDSYIAWKSDPREGPLTSDVPTPAFDGENFYVLSDQKSGSLSKVDPKDGSVQWSKELPGREKWRSSPTVADGKVYIMNHAAYVMVFSAENGDVINEVSFGDDNVSARAGIAVSQGNLFIRTDDALYSVGE